MKRQRKLLGLLASLGLLGVIASSPGTPASGSSHREAPLISQDPAADLTDVYAFVSPDDPDTVTLVMNVIPFESPAGGPNFYRFGDDVLYSFHVDTNGNAEDDLTYDFRFNTSVGNPDTFLYNTGQVTSLGDADLNLKQSYSVTETDRRQGSPKRRVLAQNVAVPPANVGIRSTPSYEANLGSQGVKPLGGGVTVFAGPRDDPFFVDLGSIFDLGGLRPFNTAHVIPLPTEDGKDYVAGFNVHSIALKVPKARLVGTDPVIGVWASTARQKVRVLDEGGGNMSYGRWVQTARLGQPLVNEVVIPIGQKDRFNASHPRNDLQFAGPVLNPELARLIPLLYPGVQVPQQVDAGLPFGGREDIATIFLTGIPGVNQPANVRPSEMLRLNTSTATAFPNGRALADDVTDIEIRAVAGATPFSPEFNVAPNNQLGDGVDSNDKPFLDRFPYLAPPWSGYGNP